MRARGVLTALLLGLVAIASSPALAVNLVTNPGFAGNLTGWTIGGTVVYDGANDATGVPGSGSAQTTFVAVAPSTALEIHQCIATGPGNYTLGGKVLIPNGQSVTSTGFVTVSYFSGGNCTTGFISASTLSTSTPGSWQTLSGPITAPAGTTNIWITGQNGSNAAGTSVVRFDDFVLDNGLGAQATDVPTLGSSGLLALLAGLGAAGLLVLRKRSGSPTAG